ncbi:MAG: hypothetical protein ACE5DX_03070 [Candidatus Dojkabacteria bacterium]
MYEAEFFKFVSKWRKTRALPGKAIWPQTITFGPEYWSNITPLREITDREGKEYELSLFYIESKSLATKPVAGSETQVRSSHTIGTKLVPDSAGKRYERRILVDGDIIKRESISLEDAKKDFDFGFLFNVHTHPRHRTLTGDVYVFYSATDINSLLASNMFMSGLITDRFYLACKTDSVVSSIGEVGMNMLNEMTASSYIGADELEKKIKTEMDSWGIVFYSGELGRMLQRVN